MKRNYYELRNALEKAQEDLKAMLKSEPGHTIYTDVDDCSCDRILGYYSQYPDCGTIDELQVKAVRLHNGAIQIILESADELFDKEAVDAMPENAWEPLYGGYVMGDFTLLTIMESIGQYAENGFVREEKNGITSLVDIMSTPMKNHLKRQLLLNVLDNGGEDILDATFGIRAVPETESECKEIVSDECLRDELGVTVFTPQEWLPYSFGSSGATKKQQ